MFGIDCMGEEEFLSLRLSLDTDYHQKRKRTRGESSNSDDEGKILALLQMREQILNLNHPNTNDGEGLHLIHSLLISATSSINENNSTSSIQHLSQLYRHLSPTGDSVQRVATYFADALLAKLLTRKSAFYDAITKNPTQDEEFLAFTSLYQASPLYQFAHFTANQAILEAYQKEQNTNNRALHVLDFDVSYGFQWPSLMQSLSEISSPTNKISLRITAFSRSQEELQETESRLTSFAKDFRNLVFDFHGFSTGPKNVKLKRKKNETLAVNLSLHLSTLNTSKICEALNFVHSLSPSIVVLVEQEGSRDSHKFLPRFMESLHYFAAIFDSLDDCLPLDSDQRLSIEKNHLGKEIRSVINYDRDDGVNCRIFEKMETWKGRMESHGFWGVEQSSKAVMQAKLLLKIRSHCCVTRENGGFRVFERDNGKAISLGWQERVLITASSWCCSV